MGNVDTVSFPNNTSMLSFAPETDNDRETICEVITAAFGRKNEADLVEAIRNSPNFIPELSLVATENGNVLGHILFSPIVIKNLETVASNNTSKEMLVKLNV